MPQKFCARCTKELNTVERTANQIQCARCYARWLQETVPAAEPIVRRLLDEIRATTPHRPEQA